MRNPLRGSAADLLPLLHAEEDHYVTTDGRVGRALACTGLNARIQSQEEADRTAARFAQALGVLRRYRGARAQLIALNRPLRGEDWVPRHMAQYDRCPAPLAHVREHLGAAYRRELAGRVIPDLAFYIVVSLPGAPAPRGPLARRFRRRRILARDRAEHAAVVARLGELVGALVDGLTTLRLEATPLGRQATIDLLWGCANPLWGRDAVAPRADAPPADARALRERLAQSRTVRRADWLRHDWGYEATLALRALPELIFAGYLQELMACGVDLRLALHVEPLPKARERRTFARRLRMRHAILDESAGRGGDVEQEEAQGEVRGLLRAMAASDEATWRIAPLVTVRAATPAALATDVGRVVAALGDAGGDAIDRLPLWQDRGWRATLPLAGGPAGLAYRAVTGDLGACLPFLHHRAGTAGGILIGYSEPGHEVVTLDLFDRDLSKASLVCCGVGGSGKTMAAQHYALHSILQGVRVIALDRSTGHFDDLAAAVGGVVHLVRPGGGFTINPWQLPRGAASPGEEKREYLLGLHQLLLARPPLEDHDLALLDEGIAATYRAWGRRDPAGPYERDLVAALRALALSSTDAGRRRRLDALADRLGPYTGDGAYARLLDGPTTVDPGRPLEVFNFKGLNDRVAPLAMTLLLEYLWTIIADPTRPTLLILDESWGLLDQPPADRFVAEIVRTGRHHGIATINLSQFVSDYDGPLGRAVVQNAAVRLLLEQPADDLGRVREAFRLTDDELALVADAGTVKGVSAGAYLHFPSGGASGAVHLAVPGEEYWLLTSYPPERTLRAAAIARHRGDVWAAVRALAGMTPAEREVLLAEGDGGRRGRPTLVVGDD